MSCYERQFFFWTEKELIFNCVVLSLFKLLVYWAANLFILFFHISFQLAEWLIFSIFFLPPVNYVKVLWHTRKRFPGNFPQNCDVLCFKIKCSFCYLNIADWRNDLSGWRNMKHCWFCNSVIRILLHLTFS